MSRPVHLLAWLFVLAGCHATTAATKRTAPADPALTVVTLNLYHDKDDWLRRRVQILDTLKGLQPDVIALQEVLQHDTLPNQAEWLANQLGYDWHFVSVDPPGKSRRYGNALLTRLPVRARHQERLRPFEDSRTVALLRVDLQGNPVNVYATHLHHAKAGGAIRRQQLEDVMAFVDKTDNGFPSVIAGDFNASADAPELAALRMDFVDTYGILHPGIDAEASSTLNLHYFTAARVDHVFHQANLFTPAAAEIILDHAAPDGSWPSDHYALVAVLRLGREAMNGSE